MICRFTAGNNYGELSFHIGLDEFGYLVQKYVLFDKNVFNPSLFVF